jgi:diazepam-binding inhibitor (GABA receptor modulating acyl-CoA-binding protein)
MKDLDIKFKKAFEIASGMKEKLPPDVMLQFYAYYKQATVDTPFYSPSGEDEVRNAFKLNAWFQVNHLSPDEAKEKYIELVEKYNNLKL